MRKRRESPKEVTPVLLLTIPQVAQALGMGQTKVYDLIKRRSLPSVDVDGRKRVSVASLHRWIEQHETGASLEQVPIVQLHRSSPKKRRTA